MDKRMYNFVSDWTAGSEKKKSTGTTTDVFGLLGLFYPKSAMCWTVYGSMLAIFGMVKSYYKIWLFPALLLFLILHLWAMSKNVRQKIYLPFVFSLTGALLIVISRMFFPLIYWPILVGMGLLLLGSLANSIADSRITEDERASN